MLRIYKDIIEMVAELQPIVEVIQRREPALADQLSRAMTSVANNVSEGSGSQGRNRRARYFNALGSQYEVRTCLDVAAAKRYIAPAGKSVRQRVDGIAAVLWTLTH